MGIKDEIDAFVGETPWYSVIKAVDSNCKSDLVGLITEYLFLENYIRGLHPNRFAVAVRGPRANRKSLPLSKKAIKYRLQNGKQLRAQQLKVWGTPEERTHEEEKILCAALKDKEFDPSQNYYRDNKPITIFAKVFADDVERSPILKSKKDAKFRENHFSHLMEIINWRLYLDLKPIATRQEEFMRPEQVLRLIHRKPK